MLEKLTQFSEITGNDIAAIEIQLIGAYDLSGWSYFVRNKEYIAFSLDEVLTKTIGCYIVL